jgi:hypothetical protein
LARRVGSIRGRVAGPAVGIDSGPAPGENSIKSSTGTDRLAFTGALSGASSNLTRGTISGWIYRRSATTQVSIVLVNVSSVIAVSHGYRFNTIGAFWDNGPFSQDIIQEVNGTYAPIGQWFHYIHSFDKSSSTGILAINDQIVSAGEFTSNVVSPLSMPSLTHPTVQAFSGTVIGSAYYSVWLSQTEFIDISVTSNRRKFINAFLEPVALGVDGSNPTGVQPLIYLDDPVATILSNRGTSSNPTSIVGGFVDSNHKPISPARYAHDSQGTAGASLLFTGVGAGDTQQLTFSAWMMPLDASGTFLTADDGATTFMSLGYDSSDRITYTFRNQAGTIILEGIGTTGTLFDNALWHQVSLSVNMTAATGADAIRISVDDTDVTTTPSTFVGSASIGFGASSSTIYWINDGITSNDIHWSQFWMDFSNFIDLSVAANRGLFILGSPTAQPVLLGNNGETPTGVSPEIYLDFPTNLGTSPITYPFLSNRGMGGDFTQVGTHVVAATNPAEVLLT